MRALGLMRAKAQTLLVLIIIIFCSFNLNIVNSIIINNDAETLLQFKQSLKSAISLQNWNPSIPPCDSSKGNWIGVLCLNGNVRGLRLENMALEGMVDINSLVSLTHLRTISFMNNTLVGSWPSVINKFGSLRSLYLSYNHFSGPIPHDAFSGMKFLKKLFLTHNEFNGQIPSSIASLSRLMQLRLDANKFEGQIPDFRLNTNLKGLNVSNNELEGPIPITLSRMDPTSFSGNKNLCGPPLTSCSRSKTKSSFSLLNIAIIVLVLGAILAVIAGVFIILSLRSKKPSKRVVQRQIESDENHYHIGKQTDSSPYKSSGEPIVQSTKRGDHGKLSFVRDDRERFDLQDLLRASAEILGSGTFGASYKATIHYNSVVVKRYKQMNNVGRDEFHDYMRRLGSLTHPNLLPLVAYYYRKEEKLLISDFVENGCLASHLHGNGHNILDWPTRLKIIKGIARGLSYLYTSLPNIAAPHGHLKSSNVLLDHDSFDPLLTDYALIPVTNLEHCKKLMMAYKSPEYSQLGRITKKTDVWSFGIVILEILTGKFPENYLTHDTKADLASWVNNMIKEKRTVEVFDVELGKGRDSYKGELLKMLKIGLNCCEEDVDRRLDLNELLIKIEELNEGDGDGELLCDIQDFSPFHTPFIERS